MGRSKVHRNAQHGGQSTFMSWRSNRSGRMALVEVFKGREGS